MRFWMDFTVAVVVGCLAALGALFVVLIAMGALS